MHLINAQNMENITLINPHIGLYRSEVKHGLQKSSCDWSSPVGNMWHFQYHTPCYQLITYGAKGFSTSSYNILTLGLKLKSCLSLLQVLYLTLSFIHLFISLSYDRSTASSKASSPDSAI